MRTRRAAHAGLGPREPFALQAPVVTVYGLVLFGEMPDIWTWIGAVVIFSSSYYIARRESGNARRPDAVMSDTAG